LTVTHVAPSCGQESSAHEQVGIAPVKRAEIDVTGYGAAGYSLSTQTAVRH